MGKVERIQEIFNGLAKASNAEEYFNGNNLSKEDRVLVRFCLNNQEEWAKIIKDEGYA